MNQFKVSIKFYDHQKILVPNCDQLTISQLVHEAEKRYKSTVEPCCRVKIFRLKTEAAEILYMEDNVKVSFLFYLKFLFQTCILRIYSCPGTS